jgi:transposase
MVLEHEHERGLQWELISSVTRKLDPDAETAWLWVRKAMRDSGRRTSATTDELAELKRLERENAELRPTTS